MENKISRKNFMKVSAKGLFIPLLSISEIINNEKVAPLATELVNEFVRIAHTDLDKTKSMLEAEPALLNATWDWGGGDFETGLEGAGHVGNKDIANYLIVHGARTNLFVLTMLGKTQIVKAYLDAYPEYLNARGPHGFTFLHHAQKGGDDAQELLEYFQTKGLKETKLNL